jgi:hypothetical protein
MTLGPTAKSRKYRLQILFARREMGTCPPTVMGSEMLPDHIQIAEPVGTENLDLQGSQFSAPEQKASIPILF